MEIKMNVTRFGNEDVIATSTQPTILPTMTLSGFGDGTGKNATVVYNDGVNPSVTYTYKDHSAIADETLGALGTITGSKTIDKLFSQADNSNAAGTDNDSWLLYNTTWTYENGVWRQ